jgi:flagellar hook assembly protein FlgD
MGMKTVLSFVGAAVVVLFVLAGCQTAKPITPQDSMIQAESAGFSPKADRGHNEIEFSVAIGNRDLVRSWKVQVLAGKGAFKTFSGDSTNLPSASLRWDGVDDYGNPAPEGTYIANLSVDYAGKLAAASVASNTFVLDLTPPTGTLTADPVAFARTSQGVQGPLTISVSSSSPVARIQSWGVDVFDSDGRLFQSFTGPGSEGTMSWDGTGLSGDLVQPTRTYAAIATIRDVFGLTGIARLAIPVGDWPRSQPAAKQAVLPGRNSVQTSLTGFSPLSETGPRSIGMALTFGNPPAVNWWKLTVGNSSKGTQKTWSGDGSYLPNVVTWDGNTDAGDWAPDGTYTAALSVDYGPTVDTVRATSRTFVLDVTPPSGSIGLSDALFSPIEASNSITLSVNATSPVARIDSWSMDIFDPGGNLFKRFSGRWPARQAVWDGKGISGEMVLSAEDYAVTVTVRDEYGNPGQIMGSVPVDILVERTATGYRILASRIFFKAFTADYHDVPAYLEKQNIARLDALAGKLTKFPGYKIKVVGHAVAIFWDIPALGRVEQEKTLIPLSQLRANAVMSALVERGLNVGMFTTEGVGAADQLVPDGKYAERWQNRRVAFFLEK